MALNRTLESAKVRAYANILYDITDDYSVEDVLAIRTQLKEITDAFFSDPAGLKMLDSDAYSQTQKREIAAGIFSECAPPLPEFLSVMASHSDMHLLARVFHQCERMFTDRLGVCVVDVVTAVPLDDKTRDLIRAKVENDLNCRAYLEEEIDKSIVGGIVMSVNGMRLDGSVRTQLARARRTLTKFNGGEA